MAEGILSTTQDDIKHLSKYIEENSIEGSRTVCESVIFYLENGKSTEIRPLILGLMRRKNVSQTSNIISATVQAYLENGKYIEEIGPLISELILGNLNISNNIFYVIYATFKAYILKGKNIEGIKQLIF